MTSRLALAGLVFYAASGCSDTPRGVADVLILAGPKDDHPAGAHEYFAAAERVCDLFQGDRGPGPALRCTIARGGWPEDPVALDSVDFVLLISAGADRDLAMHPFADEARSARMRAAFERGAGLGVIHWGLWVPDGRMGDLYLAWIGGYHDYQLSDDGILSIPGGGDQRADIEAGHPATAGLEPYAFEDEFYYRQHLAPTAVPLVTTQVAGEADPQVIAWAHDSPDTGARGFGYTAGHLLQHYSEPAVQRLLLRLVRWGLGPNDGD